MLCINYPASCTTINGSEVLLLDFGLASYDIATRCTMNDNVEKPSRITIYVEIDFTKNV